MSKFFEKILRPLLFRLDAETAHELGLKVVQLGIVSNHNGEEDSAMRAIFGPIERFGLKFTNPLGIAAGFDKNGVAVNQLAGIGFGFVEVGTVTFEPQTGNPKPRLLRLPKDRVLINRLGFNNDGAEKIAARLLSLKRSCVVGVNIGRNRDVTNEKAVENYLQTFNVLHSVANYIVLNVSSPNTPKLRELQSLENLEILLSALQARNTELGSKPLLVKISPDLEDSAIESIVDLCVRLEVNGIVATNTTTSRPHLTSFNVNKTETGGLSGKPLAPISNKTISSIYRHSKGKMPIIGVGGIFSAEDAFQKIASGACLIQAYTGFIYKGPSFAHDVNTG